MLLFRNVTSFSLRTCAIYVLYIEANVLRASKEDVPRRNVKSRYTTMAIMCLLLASAVPLWLVSCRNM